MTTPSGETTRARGIAGLRGIRRLLSGQEIGILIILLLMGTFLALRTTTFLTGDNIFNVMRAFSWIAIAGFGEIFVIIIAGIDLSVGSIMALAGLVTAMALVAGLPIWLCILIGMAVGALIGLLNGLLVSRGHLPAFIATLGTMSIARGFCYGLTNGQPVQNLPPAFRVIGQGSLPLFGLNIPYPVFIMFALALIVGIFLSRTIWGYRIYALGGNEQAARLSGINTTRIKLLVFTLSGLLAGIGGILMTSRLNVAAPTAAMGYELDVIAAVFIGGASTSGGSGTILGVLVGAAIMQVLRNGLVLLGFPAYWQPAAIGTVILIALMLDQVRRRRQV